MTEPNESRHVVSAPEAAPDRVLLSWSTHPAAARPLIAVLVSLLLIALVFVVYLLTFSVVFTIGAAVILWGSLSQFYVKTSFELTGRMVRVRYVVNKIEKPWTQYRSYYVDKHGVLLSPFVRPSRLENFRGLYVRFAENRDEVVNVVKSKITLVQDPE